MKQRKLRPKEKKIGAGDWLYPKGWGLLYWRWICNGPKGLWDEWWKIDGMHPPLPFSPWHPSTSSQLTQTMQLRTITQLMHQLPLSSMFYLSLSYHKWLAQQLLAVGGLNGSSWHSSRRWHPTAADQASIQTQFRLSQNKYTVYVCQIGCSYSWEAHLVKISCALVQPHGLR